MNTMPLRQQPSKTRRGPRAFGAMFICAALLAASPGASRAQASSPLSPLGTEVRLMINEQESRGELLAVSTDSLWIETKSRTVALPRLGLAKVEYRRHKFGARRVLATGLIISGVSTLGIVAACNSPEVSMSASECGSVTAGWLAATSVLSLLSSGIGQGNDWKTLLPEQFDQLVAHARFPQGLPTPAQPNPQPPPR